MNDAILDKNDWRPITFEGVEFPRAVMAISVLGSVLPGLDDELEGWLWVFPICKGVSKRRPAAECHRCASLACDLMLEHRDVVLAGIADRCGSDFEPLSTFSDWFLALQQIADIAARITGECEWSSPSLPGEREKMSEQIMLMGNFFESLEKRMPGST